MYLLSCVDQHRFPAPASSGSADTAYVLGIQRLASGLASIDSNQNISLLDAHRLAHGPVATFRTHHGSVKVLRPLDWQLSTVITAGDNGTVALWDLRRGRPNESVAQFSASLLAIGSLACSIDGYTIAVGTEKPEADSRANPPSITLWDIRSTPQAKTQYEEVHSDDVTDLQFQRQRCQRPPVRVDGRTGQRLRHAHRRRGRGHPPDAEPRRLHPPRRLPDGDRGLCPLTRRALRPLQHGRRLRARLGHDRLWRRPRGACLPVRGRRHGQDGRQRRHRRRRLSITSNLELVHLAKEYAWGLGKQASVGLAGAHGEEIVRAFCVLDSEHVVFTAGEDGCVRAWRDESGR